MNLSISQPEISVIIPTYNRALRLQDTIGSVLNQDGCNYEIIVVDDCSTDNTRDIVKSIECPDIYYYRLKRNSGPQVARNYGYEKAKSDILIFLDSDDLLLPGSLNSRIKYFNNHPECESSYSDYQVYFKGINKDYKKNAIVGDLSYIGVLSCMIVVPTSLLMIRSHVFNEIGKFDIKLPACHDDDLYIRCFKRNTCHYISTIAVQFINHSGKRVGSSLNLTQGRTMLLEKYKDEITKELGCRELQKHYIKNGIDYLFLKDYYNFKNAWMKMKKHGNPMYFFFIKEFIKRIIMKIGRKIRHIIFRFE